MSQFKIENKKINVEINGVTYSVRKPTFKEALEMDESTAGLSTKEKMLKIADNLASYGVPLDVIHSLDMGSVTELLEIINGSKKN